LNDVSEMARALERGAGFLLSLHTGYLAKSEHSRMIDPPRQPAAGVGIEAGFEHTVSTVDANNAVLLVFSLQFVDPMTASAFRVHRLQTIHNLTSLHAAQNQVREAL
jgi:hypothetical protein